MINKRFLKKANEWKNPKVPKPRDNSSSQKGLTQILQRGENGKPILDLTPLEKTTVNTPTQESYIELIRVYECGDWKWSVGRSLPTQKSFWGDYKENTCIEAGVDYPSGVYDEGKFGYFGREFFGSGGWGIISTQQFYETQKITPEMLNEVNVWFDRNDK